MLDLAPLPSPVTAPRRVVADVSRPSKCEVTGDPTVGVCAVETKSRCTLLSLTVPVTRIVPHGPASPHQSPWPEIFDPLSVNSISQEFPGKGISCAHLPTTFCGATASEQPTTTSASNNTDFTERIGASKQDCQLQSPTTTIASP